MKKSWDENTKRRRDTASGQKSYVKPEIDKFNLFNIDKPLDQ